MTVEQSIDALSPIPVAQETQLKPGDLPPHLQHPANRRTKEQKVGDDVFPMASTDASNDWFYETGAHA